MRKFSEILLAIILFCSSLSAQQKLSLNDLFVNGTFYTKGVYGLRSTNDGEHYTLLEGNGSQIMKYSYKTGLPVQTLLDLNKLANCPVKYINDYEFNADEKPDTALLEQKTFTGVHLQLIIMFLTLKTKKSNHGFIIFTAIA